MVVVVKGHKVAVKDGKVAYVILKDGWTSCVRDARGKVLHELEEIQRADYLDWGEGKRGMPKRV